MDPGGLDPVLRRFRETPQMPRAGKRSRNRTGGVSSGISDWGLLKTLLL